MNYKINSTDLGFKRPNYMSTLNWFYSAYVTNPAHSVRFEHFENHNISRFYYPEFIKKRILMSKLLKIMYAGDEKC